MVFLDNSWAAKLLFRGVRLIILFIYTDNRDTGYRSVTDGEDEETVPICPIFKVIGEKYGPFDLASSVPR